MSTDPGQRSALRLSPSQAIGALSGGPATLAAITDQGLGLRIGPIVERVKGDLVDQTWTVRGEHAAQQRRPAEFADRITRFLHR